MEGNKNAMYAQAGRNRGWQVVSGEMPINVPNPPMPAPVNPPMPKPMPAPMSPPMPKPMPAPMNPPMSKPMPAPPVIVAPMPVKPILAPMNAPMPNMMNAQPAVAAPNAETHAKGCQKLAMAYVEMQKWQETYEPEQGFECGTLFTELDLPFMGEGACKHG